MSELSSETRELIHQGRSELRPSEADRERIRAALQARLGSPGPVGAGTQPAAGALRALRPYVSAGVIGLALVGGAVGLAVRARQEAPPPAAPAVVPDPAPVAPPPPGVDSAAPASSSGLPAVPPAPSNAPAAAPVSGRRQPESLAQEVAILSRAAKELRSGRAADALRLLDEHQSKFPKGALSEERRAAKTEALCSLGRFAEARAELDKILRRSPQSALGARARETCKARSSQF